MKTGPEAPSLEILTAREDFPNRDDQNWMKHTLAWLDPDTGKVRLDYRPVHTYTLTNDVEYIPPKARTY